MRLLVAIAVLTIASAATAGPTLTVLGGLDDARVDAIRAEAAVRGLRVEILPTTGSDAIAAALAERPDIVAVLWIAGDTLWLRAPDGRVAHAPLGGLEVSPRVIAAIASSLIDDLAQAPTINVNVDVHVGGAPGLVDAVPSVGAITHAPSPPAWYADIGGLAAPGGIYAAHLGFGHYLGDATRAAAIAHVAKVPGGTVGAGTLELSRTWGQRLRAEVGGHALASVNFHDDVDCDSGTCMSVISSKLALGVGGYFGVGFRAGWGTIYVRAGVDVVGSRTDDATATPSGAVGVELPL